MGLKITLERGRNVRFPDKKIGSVADLLASLRSQTAAGKPVWYRGQTKKNWKLVPSLARRTKTAKAEATLIKAFKQNAVTFLASPPRTEWEWMFVMQHYRLPTRLLDWTESPLTALFFAVEQNPRHDGAVWCIDPIALNKHANISFSFDAEVPAFDHDGVLESYLPSHIASETTSDLHPIAAIASRNSPRIAAQLGTFTITHRKHGPVEAVGDSTHVWRLIVPSAKKALIKEELALLKYSRLTLFPELDQVAAHAVEFLP
jgi:hypothetical protein